MQRNLKYSCQHIPKLLLEEFVSTCKNSCQLIPYTVIIIIITIIITNTSPTDCHTSGADAPYEFRHVMPSAVLLAGV